VCPSRDERVIAYVDGFNLYFGLRDSGYQRYYWLNIATMVQKLLRPYQRLVKTKYFTARISGPDPKVSPQLAGNIEAKRQRQKTFLEVLATLKNFEIYYGHYLGKVVECHSCGRTWPDNEEKMTDVNIATELLTDAFEDRFDTALLISGDSDFVPAIRALKRLFPQKLVVVFFPPSRFSAQLKNAVDIQFTIGRRTLAKSQFPDKVAKTDGHILERPREWH